ncbi:Chitin binding Peritrophin-A domain [Chamberlinius hualienensis]
MQTRLVILFGIILTTWSIGFAQQQSAQPQAGAIPEEEYYDDEPLLEEQPALDAAQPQPTRPQAPAAPAPPPPVARPVSTLFSRPSSAGQRNIQRQQPQQQQQPTTEAPAPAPVAEEAAPVRTPTRTSSGSRASQVAPGTTFANAPNQDEIFECPEKFGFFPHHRSCDKYWKCEESQATLKLCGNGLVFDATDLKRESCNYPFAADCGDRTELEPPQGTEFCPRLYGIFADESDCRIFWSCWGGEAKKYECAPGLAFDETNRVCTWADKVDRCLKKEIAEGFSCPEGAGAESAGTYTRHGHAEDCRKFFVCIESTPRMYGCELGTVFNLETLMCDDPANVPGCEDYYGDLDLKTLKKAQLAGVGAPEKKPVSRTTAAPVEEVV